MAIVEPPVKGKFDLWGGENVVEEIISIITRHPMNENQLVGALADLPAEQRDSILADLESSPHARKVSRYGQVFWCTESSIFPNNENS